ncbi:MAG: MFS transporter [Sporichthyaceae bacterium]
MTQPAAAIDATVPEKPRQAPMLTLFALVTSAMAYALSQTLVSPALPLIQRELNTSTTMVTFVLTAYLLSASVATPIVGRLGDMFGKQRLLMAVLICFAFGSVVAAVAPSIEVLILARVIQGMGGAIFPFAFGIIRDEFPREKVATSIGLISATFGIGGGVGLIASGVIVDNLSWHWVFWIGLMVVLVAIVATHFWVPESPVKTPSKVDWTGALLLSGGLVAALVAVSEGNRWGWLSPGIVWLIALGLTLLVVLAWFELRHPRPLVDMRMLSKRAVLTPNLAGFLVGFGMFGCFILVPQFVQMDAAAGFGFGASVTEAGIFMLPSTLGMLIAGPLAGTLGSKFGSRVPLLMGTVSMTASFLFLAFVHDDRWAIYVGSALLGLGVGFAYAAMANLIIEAVPQTQTGAASGINTIMRTIGGTLGGQIAASIVASHVATNGLPREIGFTIAFAMFAAALVLATVASLFIPARIVDLAAVPALPSAEVPVLPHAPKGVVRGQIRAEDGTGFFGAAVILLDDQGNLAHHASTDLDGVFEIGDVLLAEHTMVIVALDQEPHAEVLRPGQSIAHTVSPRVEAAGRH